ncbi:MAG: ABC transporter substrate-binding protein, partial [Psychrobacillus sp.]
MKKSKFASLFLASTLLIGVLAGCNSEGGSGDGGDTIKIGINLELSGGVASYGQSEDKAIDLAVEEINGDGGIDGKKIELVKVDNKSDAGEATSGAIKLITKDKVVAIIGAATS